ncbi:MAG: PH domain-containing protein [Armatimonadetes bacterium]|nr:PH domain-containing protein [Armatimonadota bacterium]
MNDDLDKEWSSLDINVKRLWRIEAAISSLVVGGLLIPVDFAFHGAFDPLPFPKGVAMIVLAVAFAGWLQYLVGRRFHFWRYRLGDADLCVAYGIYWRTRAYVPRVRIQHVDVTAGPISRMLGLAILSVFVGGRAGAVATIPGLATAEADRLRRQLLRLEDAQVQPPPFVGEDVPPVAARESQFDPQDGGSTDV